MSVPFIVLDGLYNRVELRSLRLISLMVSIVKGVGSGL